MKTKVTVKAGDKRDENKSFQDCEHLLVKNDKRSRLSLALKQNLKRRKSQKRIRTSIEKGVLD